MMGRTVKIMANNISQMDVYQLDFQDQIKTNYTSRLIEMTQLVRSIPNDQGFVPTSTFKKVVDNIIKTFDWIKDNSIISNKSILQLQKKVGIEPSLVLADVGKKIFTRDDQDKIKEEFKNGLKDYDYFSTNKQHCKVICDSSKLTGPQVVVQDIKHQFFESIKNKKDLVILNFSKRGDVFGCYLNSSCGKKDFWVSDSEHCIFKFDYLNKTKRMNDVWRIKKNSKHDKKSFYFKSTGDCLYANMGIVVQTNPRGVPYSQVYEWINEHYDIDDTRKVVGHNQLFTVVRTIVYQLSPNQLK